MRYYYKMMKEMICLYLKDEQIPKDYFKKGESVRAVIKEVDL